MRRWKPGEYRVGFDEGRCRDEHGLRRTKPASDLVGGVGVAFVPSTDGRDHAARVVQESWQISDTPGVSAADCPARLFDRVLGEV
jgi:hypothetical protein